MTYATNLRCRECHREYPLEARHVCDFCFGPVEVTYDYDAIRRNITRQRIESGPASLWRYSDFLPCDRETAVDIGAGFTPLIRALRAVMLEGATLWSQAVPIAILLAYATVTFTLALKLFRWQ